MRKRKEISGNWAEDLKCSGHLRIPPWNVWRFACLFPGKQSGNGSPTPSCHHNGPGTSPPYHTPHSHPHELTADTTVSAPKPMQNAGFPLTLGVDWQCAGRRPEQGASVSLTHGHRSFPTWCVAALRAGGCCAAATSAPTWAITQLRTWSDTAV